MVQHQPSIEYLELFTVTAAVLKWIHRFKNMWVRLFCDNLSVCHMLNNSSARCKNCMVLIRLITLVGLQQNMRIYARHVCTCANSRADDLSRLDFKRFWRISPNMEAVKSQIPGELWPMSRVWVN